MPILFSRNKSDDYQILISFKGFDLATMKLFHYLLVGLIVFSGSIYSLRASDFSDADSAPDTLKSYYQDLTGKARLTKLLELSRQIISNNPRIAKQLSSQAASLALELSLPEEQGYALLYFGNASFLLGDYFNAQESLDRSMEIGTRLDNKKLLVDLYDAFGTLYSSTGDYQRALKYYKLGFKIILQVDFPEERSALIRKIGNIYFQFGENQKALDYYVIALEISRKGNDDEGLSMAYNNIGRIYTEQGKNSLALDYFNKSLKIKSKVGSELSIANTLLNIGRTYEQMRNFPLAEKYYRDVINLRSKVGNLEGVANAQQYLSRVFLETKRTLLGEKLLKKSLFIADSLGLNSLKVSGYRQLADLYTKHNRYKEALDAFTKYNTARDSVYSDEKRRLLVEVDARYKLESSESRIKILSKESALKESGLKKIRWVSYFWAILFLFFVIVSYLLYNSYKLKSSINKKLLQEIEERKKAQQEIEVYQKDLERIVEERTAQLREAKERAEQSDRLKSSFLANISHEIRTPMNAIIGFATFLQDPTFDKENQTEAVTQIKVNGEILLSLLNDILDISLLEVNQLKIVDSDFSVQQSIREQVKHQMLGPLTKIKQGVELRYNFDNRIDITLHADESRFRQILGNLLSNAAKFTEQGFIEIGYHIENKQIVFYVKDTGVGIPVAQQGVVFDRFSKFSASEDRFFSGTGVGLSLCRDILGLMGGKIWLDSTPGDGSTFFFTLPSNELAEEIPRKSFAVKKGALDLDLSNKTILVAEDVESNFMLVRALLQTSGAKVIWAKNGLEAVDLSVQYDVDLVLMDIRMPKLDGIEATKRIKEMFPNLPVVILTAFSHEEEMNRGYDVGCSAYLLKPIKRPELYSVVARLLL